MQYLVFSCHFELIHHKLNEDEKTIHKFSIDLIGS